MTVGLRETKKTTVAHDLARSAFTLVTERGWTVTIDDVVAPVRVSRRTFSNYYTSKEAAVAAHVVHQVSAALDQWDPPQTGQVLVLLRDLIRNQAEQGAVGALRELAALAADHPPLVAHAREAQWQVWQAVATRLQAAAPDTDDHVLRMAVGALFSVVSAALQHHAGLADVRATALRTLDLLERGLGR